MKKTHSSMIFFTPCFIFLSFILFFILSFILSADTESEVIGIIFSVKGDVILKTAEGEEECEPGIKVYKESVIILAEGSRRGKIQIITSRGPVVYSRFPVKFKESTFASLSVKQQDNFIASIGGTVLSGRASDAEDDFLDDDIDEDSSVADTLFDWHMEPGVLAREDIEKGFTLVLSREKSSKENLSLHPLYFKFRESIQFTDISFEIMKDNTFATVYENGKFSKSGNDLVFSFDCFAYEDDTPYIVEVVITFSGDYIDYWEFGYTIAGKKKIAEIEAEASRQYAGIESDFEKDLIRANVFRKYNMKLKAMQILANLGLDIEEMF